MHSGSPLAIAWAVHNTYSNAIFIVTEQKNICMYVCICCANVQEEGPHKEKDGKEENGRRLTGRDGEKEGKTTRNDEQRHF